MTAPSRARSAPTPGRRSLRAQLTWLTAAASTAAVVVLGVLVQLLLARTADSSLVRVLNDRAETIVSSVVQASTGPRVVVPQARLDADVAVYDARGRVVAGAVPDALADRYAALRTVRTSRTLAVGDAARVHALGFRTDQGVRGTVVVSERLAPYQRTAQVALWITVGAGVLLVLVSTGLVAFASRRVLAPVAEMARTADAWSEHDLGRRFDLGGSGNEISALGQTLDGLLDKVAVTIRSEQRLTSELAHELRTPLTAVQGNAELVLLNPSLDAQAREDVEEILAGCRRMSATVSGLIDLARSRSSAADGDRCAVADVVADVLDELDLATSHPGLAVSAEVGGPGSWTVPRALAVRALAPVVSNAAHFARTGCACASTTPRRGPCRSWSRTTARASTPPCGTGSSGPGRPGARGPVSGSRCRGASPGPAVGTCPSTRARGPRRSDSPSRRPDASHPAPDEPVVPVARSLFTDPSTGVRFRAGRVRHAGRVGTEQHEAGRPRVAAARRWPGTVAAAAAYLLLACLAYWPVLPWDAHHIVTCACGDAVQQAWFLRWVPFALTHGQDPLFSTYLNAPAGVNLGVNTSMPLLGLLAWPVTALSGPVAAFNLLLRLGIALSALSMHLVLRRYVRSAAAAFVGGLLFGFSPYMLGQGHLHLFLVFLPLLPLLVPLVDHWLVRADRSPWVTGALVGLVLGLEVLISIELAAVFALLVVVALVPLAVRHRHLVRSRLPALARGGPAAIATGLLVGGYPAWMFLHGPQHPLGPPHSVHGLDKYHADLLSPVLPRARSCSAPRSCTTWPTSWCGAASTRTASTSACPCSCWSSPPPWGCAGTPWR